MINYNPKDWINFIFRFHKADTFRKLTPLIIGVCIYSFAIAWLEMEYWKIADTSPLKQLPIMHSLLGFAISMLLVFRTNTAYDRWWEARKLWGSLVNNSRNLAMKIAIMLPVGVDDANRNFFRKMIPAFAVALKNHLRQESTRTELFENEPHLATRIQHDKHVPNQIAMMMFQHANDLYKSGKISGEQLIVLNAELQSFTDICGACERIRNTPIPYSYSAFIKKFIFIYVLTLPIGYVFNLGYYVVPVVAFVFYVLASLELVAEEIEEPFGSDENDLPIDKIGENIHKHVEELFHR
ncbi:MAG: hypothetical protein H7Y27_01610 [Gemmatimonadaceae bacterium]|nr:hypothetical protein [Chitinophagaceae bacterium]